MAAIERLTVAEDAAVGRLLLEAYSDCAERIGDDGSRRCDGLAHAAGIGRPRAYERMGFVVDGDLPMNFGLRYWRFRLDL